MKKIIAIVLAILFSGIVNAQSNSALIDQIGFNNNAEAEQSGTLNEISVQQNMTGVSTASGLHSISNQSGTENDAEIFQEAVRQSRANLTQDGSSNYGVITQLDYANDAIINQSGTANRGETYQAQGRFAWAEINQTGVSNEADIDQFKTIAAAVTRSKGYISQDGGFNDAYIRQDLQQRARANISQTGDDNKANIYQYGSIAIHTNHQALVSQIGNENDADVYQSGGSADGMQHELTILQDGGLNFVDMHQSGDDHFAEIEQIGSSNRVEGLGGVGPAYQDGTGHSLDVMQDGHNNLVYVSQTGASHSIIVNQTGDNSTAIVNQSN